MCVGVAGGGGNMCCCRKIENTFKQVVEVVPAQCMRMRERARKPAIDVDVDVSGDATST